MKLKLLVDAGEMKPGPTISQKIGPLGLNLGKIIMEVNKATAEFSGIKVPVILDINTKTKDVTVKVLTPPTSELLKKEFDIKKASQQPDKIKVANASIEHIIKIAKIKQPDMYTENFKSAVKSVAGTCTSLGILIESKKPTEVISEIEQGKYDAEIKESREEPSQEKLDKLAKDFEQVKRTQEAVIKELEKKAEEKAAAVAATAAAPAPGTAPAATAAPEAKKEASAKKK